MRESSVAARTEACECIALSDAFGCTFSLYVVGSLEGYKSSTISAWRWAFLNQMGGWPCEAAQHFLRADVFCLNKHGF